MEFLNPFNDGVPFHPAIVHLPLGVSMLLPGLAFLAMFAIWRRWVPQRTWWVIVGLHALLVVGAMMGRQTGEKEKDLVGGIVDDAPVEEHEAAADRFVQASVVALVVAVGSAFVSAPRVAPLAHLLVVALSLGVLILGMLAGHLGGRLVYIHDAAQAHLPANTGGGAAGDADRDAAAGAAGDAAGDKKTKSDKTEKGKAAGQDDADE